MSLQFNESTPHDYAPSRSLCIACENGHTERARMLLTKGGADANQARTDTGSTPLYIASKNGHTELARMLLTEGGADANQARTNTGSTPLYIASKNGHTELARMLLTEFGANVNQARTDNGATPLCIASFKGRTELARMLVTEFGANVNQARTDTGATPLYVASFKGRTELARMLVTEFGANVNQATTSDGTTPLYIASQMGHTQIVRTLVIEGGARIDQPQHRGWRPLHVAAGNGNNDACFALCALGADMDLSPPEGQTPIRTSSQPFAGWIQFARGLGNALCVALERRDYPAAIHLLQSRQTVEPTPRLVREQLLPIASTVDGHALARPVCGTTRRVAEVACELYSDRWSRRAHALCGEGQRDAVMAVLTITRRRGQGMRPRAEDEGDDPYEQVGKLPRWMHGVMDDVWWKVLEMMGMW